MGLACWGLWVLYSVYFVVCVCVVSLYCWYVTAVYIRLVVIVCMLRLLLACWVMVIGIVIDINSVVHWYITLLFAFIFI